MRQRLTRRDALLLVVTLPLFLVVFALHVHESGRTGLAQLPVFATWQPGDYPRVGGYRLETDSSGSGLLPGDRLLSVGGRDLRNQGYIGFQAVGLAQTTPGHPAALVFERGGERRTVPLEARPHPHPWARIPVLLLIPTVCVLLLLAAPGQPDAQRFYLCFMTYAIGQAQFYGGPEWQTWIAGILWQIAAPLMLFFMLRCARFLPAEMREEDRVPGAVPWVATALYVVLVRVSYVFGWPLPAASVPAVSFGLHGAMMVLGIGILARNYLRAAPAGCRRLRWILLGTGLGSFPVVAAALSPLLLPGWSGFRETYQAGFLASAIWMVGAVLAVVRDNAFDVDRLIGATAAWTLAVGGAVAGLVVGVPAASASLSQALALDPIATRVVLAAVLGAGVLPVVARLRPQIDRVLFPGRRALEEGAEALGDELGGCEEPDALLERATRGMQRLVDAEWSALWLRAREGVAVRLTKGDAPPPPTGPAAAVLPARARPGNAGSVAPRGSIAVPIARGAVPDAWVLLGPKRSGDIYTGSDAGVLTALAVRVEAAWVRFEKRQAEREVREKTNLLATAGHDLRQPLHAVSLLTEALQGKLDDPEMRALVARIGASTHDLDEMLTHLLDRSKLDAGAVRPEVDDVALADVFAQLDRDLGPQAEACGVRLRMVRTGLAVRSDRLLLARMLRNLVSNALRYGDGAAVCVAARPRGGRVAIEVRDGGPGIPAEHQRAVFEAFRQLPGGAAGGLGLGLSIVEGLGSLLAHEVTLRSAPGRGSTFTVWAPRAVAAEAAARARAAHLAVAPAEVRGAAGPRALGVRRVLVVDDDPRVREATGTLLRGWGCDVREAGGRDAALATVADPTWRPDFVLADYALARDAQRAGGSGVAVVAALRQALGGALPAAILTGETDPAQIAAIRAEGLRVLRKPVRPARLRALLSAREAPEQQAS